MALADEDGTTIVAIGGGPGKAHEALRGEVGPRRRSSARFVAPARGCEDRAAKVSMHVRAEWASLSRTDDLESNRRSIEVVREWLDGAADALAAGKVDTSAKDPKLYGHGKSNVPGITHPDFDGVDMATLRYWLRWWSSPSGRCMAVRRPVGIRKPKPSGYGAKSRRESGTRRYDRDTNSFGSGVSTWSCPRPRRCSAIWNTSSREQRLTGRRRKREESAHPGLVTSRQLRDPA